MSKTNRNPTMKTPSAALLPLLGGALLVGLAGGAGAQSSEPEVPAWQQSLEQEMQEGASGNLADELADWRRSEAERKAREEEWERQEKLEEEKWKRQEKLAEEERERQRKEANRQLISDFAKQINQYILLKE